MISHFMGAGTYAGDNSEADVFLTEILFGFGGGKSKNCLDAYRNLYRKLAKGLNSLKKSTTNINVVEECKPMNINVVGECLTYQDVFRNRKMHNRVKMFYQL